MNRSLLRPGLLVVAILTLGLAGCGQGIGPGLTPSSPEPTPSVVTETVIQTVDEVTEVPPPPPPPTEEPPPTTPGPVTLTFIPPVGLPATEYCVSYDPANLKVVAGSGDWLLRSGNEALMRFDTAGDAEDGRRVARNWRQLCFIGLSGTGPDRYRHIVTYFKEPSGLPLGTAPATIDCITYNPNNLALYEGPSHPAKADHHYWSLYSGSLRLLELDNYSDALRARMVAAGYTRLCFIGAGNDRPDPYRYQMEWWRA